MAKRSNIARTYFLLLFVSSALGSLSQPITKAVTFATFQTQPFFSLSVGSPRKKLYASAGGDEEVSSGGNALKQRVGGVSPFAAGGGGILMRSKIAFAV